MKLLRLTLPLAALMLSAGSASAYPTCPTPTPGLHITFGIEIGKMSESERAAFYEQQLRARGIDASSTRFWDNCLQTFVRENGHTKMKFYDPDTLEEVQ